MPRLQATETQIARFVVLPRQHRLEDRRIRQAARRIDDFHHLLEWQVLVLLRRQHLGLHLLDQRRHRRAVVQLRAHRQRVDEESDQPLGLAAAAVRHRRAHHHVRLPRQPRQHHRPRRQQRHVQGRAVLQAKRLECLRQRRLHAYFQQRAAIVLLRRTLAVGRQRQQGRGAAQRLAPVVAFTRQPFALQALPLPYRVIRVLHRQRRQRVRFATHPRRIQRFQLARQHAHRPAVGHDVVHRQQQHMAAIAQRVVQCNQAAAQQRAAFQIERRVRLQHL